MTCRNLHRSNFTTLASLPLHVLEVFISRALLGFTNACDKAFFSILWWQSWYCRCNLSCWSPKRYTNHAEVGFTLCGWSGMSGYYCILLFVISACKTGTDLGVISGSNPLLFTNFNPSFVCQSLFLETRYNKLEGMVLSWCLLVLKVLWLYSQMYKRGPDVFLTVTDHAQRYM